MHHFRVPGVWENTVVGAALDGHHNKKLIYTDGGSGRQDFAYRRLETRPETPPYFFSTYTNNFDQQLGRESMGTASLG